MARPGGRVRAGGPTLLSGVVNFLPGCGGVSVGAGSGELLHVGYVLVFSGFRGFGFVLYFLCGAEFADAAVVGSLQGGAVTFEPCEACCGFFVGERFCGIVECSEHVGFHALEPVQFPLCADHLEN